MSYRICYDIRKKRTRSRIPAMTFGFLILFAALYLREPAQDFWNGHMEMMAAIIEGGNSVVRTVSAFCLDLLENVNSG